VSAAGFLLSWGIFGAGYWLLRRSVRREIAAVRCGCAGRHAPAGDSPVAGEGGAYLDTPEAEAAATAWLASIDADHHRRDPS
jgi:hypothetical protein